VIDVSRDCGDCAWCISYGTRKASDDMTVKPKPLLDHPPRGLRVVTEEQVVDGYLRYIEGEIVRLPFVVLWPGEDPETWVVEDPLPQRED
jgi:hypothetical protein